jgi:RHS repeat-associated protein
LEISGSDQNEPTAKTVGVTYYGYRWYDPVTGRWPSRDPQEENGGGNLYGFCLNKAIYIYDFLGLNWNDGVYGPASYSDWPWHFDQSKFVLLKGTRQYIKSFEFNSRIEAGGYGAKTSAYLTKKGPRILADRYIKPPKGKTLGVEYGGRVCCRCIYNGGGTFTFKYYLTGPITTGQTREIRFMRRELCPDDTIQVGSYHSHPGGHGVVAPGSTDRNFEALNDKGNIKNDQSPCIKENPRSQGYVAALSDDESTYQMFIYNSGGSAYPEAENPVISFE